MPIPLELKQLYFCFMGKSYPTTLFISYSSTKEFFLKTIPLGHYVSKFILQMNPLAGL